ncbi:hypothetical protein AB0B28_14935 [Glycomyces sp. NPDC046736]|uniref:hypothetical protein n=1 Tax=Glycomyces sp. NPDC046736 TaxID=3155615 RepID=UPI0033CC6F1B
MTDTETLRRRLHDIHAQLRGEPRLAALEAHLEAVDAHGDRPLVNETLVELVKSYETSQDSTRLLVPFARLSHEYDTAPEHFDEVLVRRLYWISKWVIGQMIDHPDVPLATIEEWVERLHARYAEAGYSLHPVHEAEHSLAEHIGDDARAAEAAEAMRSTEPDDMSNCEACRCSKLGWIALDDGDDAGALAIWEPILNGGLRCQSQPHGALSGSLLALAALGELDQARTNHLYGYRISRGKDDMASILALHVRFCALTGNEARALEILAAEPGLFAPGIAPRNRLKVLETLQILCAALLSRGLGATAVPGPERREWTAEKLHDWADAERCALAEAYDQRNGNEVQSRQSQERAVPTRTYPHVPLGLRRLPEPERIVAAESEPAEGTESLDAALVAARESSRELKDDRDARWREVGRLAAALGADLDAEDAAEVVYFGIDPSAGREAAQASVDRAVALFTEAGKPGRALQVRAWYAAWLIETDPGAYAAAAAPLLEAAEALAAEDAEAGALSLASLRIGLAHSEIAQDRVPDSTLVESLRESAAALAQSEDRRALMNRAQILSILANTVTELDTRIAAFQESYDFAVASGLDVEVFTTAGVLSSLLSWAGRHAEGLEVAGAGLAARWPDCPPFPVAALHLTAAECALHLGEPGTAEQHALWAADFYDRAGEQGCAGVARHLLGKTLSIQERFDEAIVILEAALEDLPAIPEESWRLVDARVLLAEAGERCRDNAAALGHVLEALRLLDEGQAHPDRAIHARASHLAGELHMGTDDPAAAVAAFRRAEADWRELGGLPQAANSIRAAVWAGVETAEPDLDAASAAMSALAEELRAEWRAESEYEGYRHACRIELIKTLTQHAHLIRQRTAEALAIALDALTVSEEGEHLAEFAVQAAHRALNLHGDNGDLDAAEALALRVTERLDPNEHAHMIAEISRHLTHLRQHIDA